jgi:hypothetical protein
LFLFITLLAVPIYVAYQIIFCVTCIGTARCATLESWEGSIGAYSTWKACHATWTSMARLNLRKSYLFHKPSAGDFFFTKNVTLDEVYNFLVLSFPFVTNLQQHIKHIQGIVTLEKSYIYHTRLDGYQICRKL